MPPRERRCLPGFRIAEGEFLAEALGWCHGMRLGAEGAHCLLEVGVPGGFSHKG